MEEKKDNVGFDVMSYLQMCVKKWWWFAIAAVVFAILGVAIGVLFPQRFEVDAQVMLPPEMNRNSMVLDIAKNFSIGDMFEGSNSTDNEVAVMKSHDQFLRTAKQLDLNVSYFASTTFKTRTVRATTPIRLEYDKTIADTLSVPIIIKLKRNADLFDVDIQTGKIEYPTIKGQSFPIQLSLPYGEFTLETTDFFPAAKFNKFTVLLTSYSEAAQVYASSVLITIPSKKTDFIALSYITNDTEFGKKLLSTVINNYNAIGDFQKVDRNNRTLKLVNDRLASLQEELGVSEANIESFKRANNLTDLEADASILLSKEGTLDRALIEVQTQNEILKITADFVNNPANRYELIPALSAPSGTGSTAAIAPSSATSDIAAYNELVLQRMKLLTSAKPDNAAVKLIEEQLNALYENIRESVARAYKNSTVQLRELQSQAGSTKAVIHSYPELERQFLGMKRLQQVQEQLYLFLLKQREETAISLTNSTLSCIVIDEPYVALMPVGMSKKTWAFVFAFLGLFLGGALVWAFRYRKIGFSSAEALNDSVTIPLLGTIPAQKGNSATAVSEAIDRLRADLIFTMQQFEGKTLLVTEGSPSQGAPTIASELASALGKMGKKTVLIDADLRNPSLGEASGSSLIDYLEGSASMSAIIESSDLDDLSVIHAGTPTDNPVRPLASPRMQDLINDIKEQFDYVIIVGAPLSPNSETFALAPCIDMTLVVEKANAFNKQDIALINRLAEESRLPRMAVLAVDC